jgi:hypothetical protein
MEQGQNYFQELYDVDVREKTKKKPGKDALSYLSWASAWSEVKKKYPNAQYEIVKFGENFLPYVFDKETGYLVYTRVTINDITHEMCLPVMDGANKSMSNEPYTYTTKYGDKNVDKASMFDINKTIMRCLTKNLAMHGLGLYLYEGEDLPEETKNVSKLQLECFELVKSKAALSENAKSKVAELCKKADESANGDPRLIESSEALEALKKALLAVRK